MDSGKQSSIKHVDSALTQEDDPLNPYSDKPTMERSSADLQQAQDPKKKKESSILEKINMPKCMHSRTELC